MSEPSTWVPQWDGIPRLDLFVATFSEAREVARLELQQNPSSEPLRELQAIWLDEIDQLTIAQPTPTVWSRVRSAANRLLRVFGVSMP